MVSNCNSLNRRYRTAAAVGGLAATAFALVTSACMLGAPEVDSAGRADAEIVGNEQPQRSNTVPPPSTTTSMPTPSSSDSTQPVETSTPMNEDGPFRWVALETGGVRVVWRDDQGSPYRQLENARSALEADGLTVLAMANGGIYDEALTPLGLHIEDGVELNSLNSASGSGNFFLEPNGVFAVTDAGFIVMTTDRFEGIYIRDPGPSVAAGAGSATPVLHAVQSGPMLVVDGAVNSLFTAESQSVTIRTAVGTDDSGNAVLLQARRPVNMWTLAEKGRQLGLTNLLYLDGSVARLDSVTPDQPIFPNVPLAAMIAVVESDGSDG